MRCAPLLCAGLVALTTACSGPSTPINATLKSFPQQVRLGAAPQPPTVAVAPIPPSAPLFLGGFVLPDLPGAPAGVPAPPPVVLAPDPCPPAPFGAAAELPSSEAVTRAPRPATYAFRTSGKHVVGGAHASTTVYPTTSTRQVGASSPVTLSQDGFAYSVTAVLGSNRTVTSYLVLPTGQTGTSAPAVQNTAVPLGAGLYVTSVATFSSDGKRTSSFSPQPPMQVLPFPATTGTVFHVQSADPQTGVMVAYDGQIGTDVAVDACGKVVDSRSVTHTGAVTLGHCGPTGCTPLQGGAYSTQFTGRYAIATQYGGLSVQDTVRLDGSDLDAPFSDELTGVINRVPAGT